MVAYRAGLVKRSNGIEISIEGTDIQGDTVVDVRKALDELMGHYLYLQETIGDAPGYADKDPVNTEDEARKRQRHAIARNIKLKRERDNQSES